MRLGALFIVVGACATAPVAVPAPEVQPPVSRAPEPASAVRCRGRVLASGPELDGLNLTVSDPPDREVMHRMLDALSAGDTRWVAIRTHLTAKTMTAELKAPDGSRHFVFDGLVRNGCEVVAIADRPEPIAQLQQELIEPEWLTGPSPSAPPRSGASDLVHGICDFFSPGRCGNWTAEQNYLERTKK